jgi:ferredoxin
MKTIWNHLKSLFGITSKEWASAPATPQCLCPPKSAYRFEYPQEKTIKRVYINEGCMICAACPAACPEVFHLPEEKDSKGDWQSSFIKPGSEAFFESKKEQIHRAADGCCVSVIKIEYQDGTQYVEESERRHTGQMTKVIPAE